MCLHHRKPAVTWAASKQVSHGQLFERGDSPPLLHPIKTPPAELHPVLGPPAQTRHGPLRVGPEEGHKDDHKAGTPLQQRKA